ncbi:MAG: hypothetical protein H7Z41_03730, partial [Cytophagales bacterium]|nr:hypothetical protein [Armatimonadota bacterium]
MPQNAAAAAGDAPAEAEREALQPFPADRNTLSLRRGELSAGGVVHLRFTLRNSVPDAVLHVRLSAAAAAWLSLLPTEAALGPGEQQPVVVRVESAAAAAALKTNGPPTIPIPLAYQYLRAGAAAAGTGTVFLRLPTSVCPSCSRHLDDDEHTGRIPDVCPFCFERLRPCPVCGTPNSWLARTCILDETHVVRTAPDWPQLGGEPGHRGSRP